jgi:hypothetical protein
MEENAAMPSEAPDLRALSERLDLILERLSKLEVQVRGLVTSQTVEAKEFVVKDDRAVIRARLEMEEYAPCLTFYDGAGQERLKIGLRADGSPSFHIDRRDIPLGDG